MTQPGSASDLVERIDDLVTDRAADPSALEELRAAGVHHHLADLDPTAQERDQP